MIRASAPRSLVLAAALLASVSAARAADDSDRELTKAVHAVRTFYKFHMSHDMGFTEKSVVKRKPWLAPDFYPLLLQEVRRPGDPDEAPFIDGDPFTDSQESPTRFRTGAARRTGDDEITVDVDFRWTRRVREYRQYRWRREPVDVEVDDRPPRRLIVKLTRGEQQWRIADLISDNGQSLRASLEARNVPQLPTKPPDWMSKPTPSDPLAPGTSDRGDKFWEPSH